MLVESGIVTQDQLEAALDKQKKERKRLWRRWKPNREQYNPYIKKSEKKRTSSKIARGTKREMRKQKRNYQKELKRTRRKKGISDPEPT